MRYFSGTPGIGVAAGFNDIDVVRRQSHRTFKRNADERNPLDATRDASRDAARTSPAAAQTACSTVTPVEGSTRS